jgi:hypothetical protein
LIITPLKIAEVISPCSVDEINSNRTREEKKRRRGELAAKAFIIYYECR